MRVRLTQLDGSLPNLALMKLAHWHRERGDEVHYVRHAHRDLMEPDYDRVYGSAIFAFSADRVAEFMRTWPGAIVGGTGSESKMTIEEITGPDHDGYDYSLYPWYEPSLGFTQRGCRLSCKFCVVPGKEGKNRSVSTIADIWRGEEHPRKIHLLDNDFFGQPEEQWRARVEEIRAGGFKVCLNQGINVRLLTPAAAEALATIEYRDDAFKERRLYTAWDNLKDEGIFFKGMDMLEAAGIPPKHVMSYMLVGFDKNETWDRLWHRFNRMVERGISPYPMVFDCRARDADRYRELKRFQRWVVTGLYRAVPFSDYDAGKKAQRKERAVQLSFLDAA
ncbi:radical SAM protein [Azospirillum canadense]|uniref:radical SAM protein n=1 Tax=Azospirillum canadense TaxID=403962 RepID=UPI002227BDB1|nr:radical SAM protein [Azospirillum canadense]MCW2242302.1 hypothetical protein [Azospirillum canadense]